MNGIKAIIESHLRYDPETGEFWWKQARKGRSIGKPAGSRYPIGYIYIKLKEAGESGILAHRVAWLLTYGEWPEEEIDHINGDRADNRIRNLRSVTRRGNSLNRKRNSNNSSGVCGVSFHKHSRRWAACIIINGKNVWLGRFKTIDEAVAVRKAAEREHGFHPNHGRG